VSSSCNGEALARKLTVVAVVRLLVTGTGDLTHGEVVTASGRVVARFRTWTGLVPALQDWISHEDVGDADRTTQGEDGP
jgi:hypothetical protein